MAIREAKLTAKETEALNKSLRISKRKPKIETPKIDQIQAPPYAILPLLPYIPKEWIVWDSNTRQGFLGEAIRALHGNIVIESGLELDGTDFLKVPPKTTAQVQITKPPFSIKKFDWIARSYDNHQAFALLMQLDTWATAEAQSMFQQFGMSIILINRPIQFYVPRIGWGKEVSVAWFTWGLPYLTQPVTYGQIPQPSRFPKWMVRPNHRREIAKGAESMQDRSAIRHATHPNQWPAPIRKEDNGQERK
jgi:hypothetical protein